MEYAHRIESRGQMNLLGVGKMLPWEASMVIQFEMWKQY
jgi:hypothetical protein